MKRKTASFKPKRKPKRSRGFWAQRKTAQITPCPIDSDGDDAHDIIDNEDIKEVERLIDNEPDDRELLIKTFANNDHDKVVSDNSHDDDDSSEDEDGDDHQDVEEQEDDQDMHTDLQERETRSIDRERGAVELGNDIDSAEDDEDDHENDDDDDDDDHDDDDEEDDNEDDHENDDNEDDHEDDDDDDAANDDEAETKVEAEESQTSASYGDPFLARHELHIDSNLREAIASRRMLKEEFRWEKLGLVELIRPDYKAPKKIASLSSTSSRLHSSNAELLRREELLFGAQSKLISMNLELSRRPRVEDNPFVKPQLKSNLNPMTSSTSSVKWGCLEDELFYALNSYRDLSYCSQTLSNSKSLRSAYVLHVLNHVLKTRAQIVLHNEKLSKKRSSRRGRKESNSVEYRDQGFCRPKVLILLPFRETARQVIALMMELLLGVRSESKSEGRVFKKQRFDEEFGSNVDVESAKNKPDDFYEMFRGNMDDAFKIGLAVTKKSLKLFTDFYSSDIIIASPLGLRMAMNHKQDAGEDHDFLSAIEILVLDQTDVFMMQNWDHVKSIFEKLNKQPKVSHGADFSRVRMWALEGHSALYRQTLFLSSMQMAEINALARGACSNYLGRMHTNNNSIVVGAINHVVVQIPLFFHRFKSSSVMESPKERLHFFLTHVLPEYKKDVMYHTCVFVPSYFDYVRVRNAFKTADLDFLEVCEYTKEKKMAKARDKFFHSETHFLLYTERIHFYRRFTLKGIRHLIFYQLPQYPDFFAELSNFMQAIHQNRKGGSDGNMSCRVIFDHYDALRLAAVVGSQRATTMMQSAKNTHMIVAGSHT